MRHIIYIILLTFAVSLNAQELTWTKHDVNGHMTGVTQGPAGKTYESMGKVKKFKSYYSPNGKRHKKKTTARKSAKAMIKAQDSMTSVKEVIGYSKKSMTKQRPECALTNWFIDVLMEETAKITNKKVDIGLSNFGGVRTDMPEGEIYRDDIMSMFPFKNTIYYFTMTGKSVKKLLKDMAARKPEIVGGIRAEFKDNQVVNATIGGEPIEDDKIYGVATINFLMEGSGWFRFGKYAIDGEDTNANVMDVMLKYVEEQTKQGKKIEYKKDGRIKRS